MDTMAIARTALHIIRDCREAPPVNLALQLGCRDGDGDRHWATSPEEWEPYGDTVPKGTHTKMVRICGVPAFEMHFGHDRVVVITPQQVCSQEQKTVFWWGRMDGMATFDAALAFGQLYAAKHNIAWGHLRPALIAAM